MTPHDVEKLGEEKRGFAIASRGALVRWYAGSWEFLLSRSPIGLWIFSAMLFPRGRGSVAEDWRFLGAMGAAVGVPAGEIETVTETEAHRFNPRWPPETPTELRERRSSAVGLGVPTISIETDPNGVHKWAWMDRDGVPCTGTIFRRLGSGPRPHSGETDETDEKGQPS